MTHRLLVQFGRPTDPAAFDQYFRDVHAPLGQKIPGVIRYDVGHADPVGDDTVPYLISTLDFESAEAFAAALQAPEGAAAAADLHNFATGGVTLSHYDVQDLTP